MGSKWRAGRFFLTALLIIGLLASGSFTFGLVADVSPLATGNDDYGHSFYGRGVYGTGVTTTTTTTTTTAPTTTTSTAVPTTTLDAVTTTAVPAPPTTATGDDHATAPPMSQNPAFITTTTTGSDSSVVNPGPAEASIDSTTEPDSTDIGDETTTGPQPPTDADASQQAPIQQGPTQGPSAHNSRSWADQELRIDLGPIHLAASRRVVVAISSVVLLAIGVLAFVTQKRRGENRA